MRIQITSAIFGVFFLVCFGAEAQDKATKDEARAAYSKGVKLFNAGFFEDAAVAFNRAYEVMPNWKIKYNIGQTTAAAKKYGQALEAFEQYLAEGGDDIPAERKDEVLQEVRRLREMVAFLEVNSPEGCEVIVDNSSRGTTPLVGPVMVSSGIKHKIVVTIDGVVLVEREVRLSGGHSVVIEAQLDPVPQQNDSSAPQPEVIVTEEPGEQESAPGENADNDDGRQKKLKTLGLVFIGTGAASLIGGSVVGGMAISKNNALVEDCAQSDCTANDSQDEMDTYGAMANASTALLIAGGVFVATGVVLLIVKNKQSKEEKESTSKVSFNPAVGPGFVGTVIKGSF